jgi:hypothetical protein
VCDAQIERPMKHPTGIVIQVHTPKIVPQPRLRQIIQFESEVAKGYNGDQMVFGDIMMRHVGLAIFLGIGLAAGVLHAEVVLCPDQGKTEITLPGDLFLHRFYGEQDLNWVKFTILKTPHDANIVYFQDSNRHLLHVDFATQCLAPLQGMPPAEFDRISLFEQGQQVVLGAVLLPVTLGPTPRITEYGIQLVRLDPYTPEETVQWLRVVQNAIAVDPNAQAFYFPTYEQKHAADLHRDWFAGQGFPVGSADRWIQDNVIYAPGWTLGRLHYVRAHEIQTAYASGDLLPIDILLTDGIPAEVPHVAGIISLAPATPNSHVAILSRTLGIPFVYLASEDQQQQAWDLEGHPAALRAVTNISLVSAGTLNETQTADLLALKAPEPLRIRPIQASGVYHMPTDPLTPEHINRVGGKAANFGLLRRAIPDNSPRAMALTFDLWMEFLDQPFSGQTLRTAIADRLSHYTYPPLSMAELEQDLRVIQGWFKDDTFTAFTQAQHQAVLDALTDPTYGFDPYRNIRFRSSTNMEDSDLFSGAGLYDSFSGCLADDLDLNTKGPCLCDPNEDKERGVFRAIRKVFASFYNRNAVLERLQYQIRDSEVGMAILVHHSYPDAMEWANGVVVYTNEGQYARTIELTTQPGAVSVTRADPGLVPEQVEVYVSSFDDTLYPTVRAYSSLMPLGRTVMTWDKDYQVLSRLCLSAAEAFERVTGKTQYVLDFEFKKVAPEGRLIVKQIREVPAHKSEAVKTPFLVGGALSLQTFQGEHEDVFANHRLKSQWHCQADSGWLDEPRLQAGLLNQIDLTYQAQGDLHRLVGQPNEFPSAGHRVALPEDHQVFRTRDHWVLQDLETPRDMSLSISLQHSAALQSGCPLVTLQDLDFAVDVNYADPVPGWGYQDGDFVLVDREADTARLVPPQPDSPSDLPQHRRVRLGDIEIDIEFSWPPHPTGPVAGYTAPLQRWQQTVITGLTDDPMVLTGYYAQTYRPEHHNFFEHFLFEPRLEPGLSPSVLKQLDAQGVTQIHVFTGPYGAEGQSIFLYPGQTSGPGGR